VHSRTLAATTSDNTFMKWTHLLIIVGLIGCKKQDKTVSGDDYTTSKSGLKYKIIQTGTGEPAKEGNEVLIFETTKYRNGTILYSNENTDNPVQILIGGNQATEGVDEGLRGMKVGEIREIIAPPYLVKRKSYPPNVSPDSTLVIKLILHKIL
jgi:FKBP-type peptidyl-prolyl cis-trans isomerase